MTFKELELGQMFHFADDPDRIVCTKLPTPMNLGPGMPFIGDYRVNDGGYQFRLKPGTDPEVVPRSPFLYYDTPPHARGTDVSND
jgi:hypothetical protein